MPFTSKAIANYLLDRGFSENVPVSPMKLQKLVYFSHGWHLGITDLPLIDEQVEAWKYGPVVNSLFHAFKSFGNDSITRYAFEFIPSDENEFGFKRITPNVGDERRNQTEYPPDNSIQIVHRVWEIYKCYSAVALSNKTHEEGGPWHRIVKVEYGGNPPKGTDIPQQLIKDYFKSRLNQQLVNG